MRTGATRQLDHALRATGARARAPSWSMTALIDSTHSRVSVGSGSFWQQLVEPVHRNAPRGACWRAIGRWFRGRILSGGLGRFWTGAPVGAASAATHWLGTTRPLWQTSRLKAGSALFVGATSVANGLVPRRTQSRWPITLAAPTPHAAEMPNTRRIRPRPAALRRGRSHRPRQTYLVTFTTNERAPHFADYRAAITAARAIEDPRHLGSLAVWRPGC